MCLIYVVMISAEVIIIKNNIIVLNASQVKFNLFVCLYQLARLTPEQPRESKDLYTWCWKLFSYFDKMNVNIVDGPMYRPRMWGKPFADMFLFSAALLSQYSGAMLQLCPDVFISGHLSATIIQPGCNWTPLLPWPTSTDPQPLSASAVEEKREQLGEPPADPLPTQKEIKKRLAVRPPPHSCPRVYAEGRRVINTPVNGFNWKSQVSSPSTLQHTPDLFPGDSPRSCWMDRCSSTHLGQKKKRRREAEQKCIASIWSLSYYLAVLTRSRLSY